MDMYGLRLGCFIVLTSAAMLDESTAHILGGGYVCTVCLFLVFSRIICVVVEFDYFAPEMLLASAEQ